MDLQVDFYIGKYDKVYDSFLWHPLERTLFGDTIRYRRIEGLENAGKVKNLYVESYADSSVQRIDVPSDITRDSTNVKLDLIILRGNRRQSNAYQSLVDYFSEGITVYWDTQRRRVGLFYYEKATEPSKDTYLGTPYLEVEFEFTTVNGICPIINDTFTNNHLANVEAYARPILLTALS